LKYLLHQAQREQNHIHTQGEITAMHLSAAIH